MRREKILMSNFERIADSPLLAFFREKYLAFLYVCDLETAEGYVRIHTRKTSRQPSLGTLTANSR